jgi:hypothetical protein
VEVEGNFGHRSMTLHLTEAQREYVAGLAQQLPAEQRDTFIGAVRFRLGGRLMKLSVELRL